MTWVIVKYAAAPHWKEYWVDNPAKGVLLENSCHSTYSGRVSQIQPVYEDKKAAQIDCLKINSENPCGYYEVCPVLDSM